ncbi:MAG TPA: ABC transporter permease [Dehalococcoidia bacterium]|nr:ABC transporter permease [Dehalococcoidia bacterium]
MTQYIIKRLLLAVLVLWIVSVIVFSAVRVIPGDVCKIVTAAPDVDARQCASIKHGLGLDKPVVTQYLGYMGGVLHGDFGTALISKRKVWPEIRTRIPLTIELAVLATVFAMVLALPIGIISAMRRDGPADYGLRLLTIGWLSIPGFWLGTMLIIYPAKWWGYSPPPGYTDIWHDPAKNLQQLYLPAIALGLALCASLARITRSSMLEVLRQDYVRTARAKGLVGRVVVTRHALKNAMIPVITLFAVQFGFLLGGTVVLESIFSLPGLGQLTLASVLIKDYPVVQGLVLFFATVLILINLLVDISYAWFDPRIRYA